MGRYARFGSSVACIALLGLGSMARAVDDSGGTLSLEEIVVTAQKRTERLQDVPMSISALGPEQLQDRAIETFIDYATVVPDLGFGYTGAGFANARTISIRGVSGTDTTGFYLDETPVPESIDPRIVDIARIEVLRGPQGTLYGARSEGGTVRVITDQPDPDAATGRIHTAISDTWNTVRPNYEADGAFNLPLIPERLAMRVVGLFDSEAGFFRREYPSNPPFGSALETALDVAHDWTKGASLSLLWKVSEALSITPRVLYQEDTYNGFPYSDHTTYALPPPAIVPPLNLAPNNFVQRQLYNQPEGGTDRWTLASLAVTYHTGAGDFVSSSSYFDRNVFETEGFADWLYQNLGMPFDSTISAGSTAHEFVQELRFSSRFSGAWQFVSGLYYESLSTRPLYYPPLIIPGFNAYLGGTASSPAPGTNPGNPDEFDGNNWHQRQTEPAGYGEIYYSPTSQLKLTAGVRVYQTRTTSTSYLEGFAGGGPRITSPPDTLTQTGANPKAEIEYKISDDQMVYASASKGFRPGGVSFVIPTAFGCSGSLASLGLTAAEAQRFKSDSLWSYEIGEKGSWLDGRLSINAAAYYIDWKNLQQAVLLSCGFEYTGNVGAAKSEGGELEAHLRPFRSLELSTGVGYTHAVITDSGITSPQQPGSPVFQVPDWTANASATYSRSLTSETRLVTNVSYAFVDRSYSGNNNPAEPRIRPSYELVNGRIGLDWSRYELAFVGKNLSNTHANLADNVSIAAEVIGRPRIVTNQPRTLGLELIGKF